jgi:hypothetical protein
MTKNGEVSAQIQIKIIRKSRNILAQIVPEGKRLVTIDVWDGVVFTRNGKSRVYGHRRKDWITEYCRSHGALEQFFHGGKAFVL